MKIIVLLILSLCSSFVSHKQQMSFIQKSLQAEQEEINMHQAVAIAEKFIAENGYTKIPVADKSKIAFESLEGESDVDAILKSRYNTLQEKAYGIRRDRKADNKGWTVIFRYTDKKQQKNGRAVTMNLDGTNLRVEHQDIFLKAAEKKFGNTNGETEK
jgi:hypothetical protein